MIILRLMEIKYDKNYKIFKGAKGKGKRRIERKLLNFLLVLHSHYDPLYHDQLYKSFFPTLVLVWFG